MYREGEYRHNPEDESNQNPESDQETAQESPEGQLPEEEPEAEAFSVVEGVDAKFEAAMDVTKGDFAEGMVDLTFGDAAKSVFEMAGMGVSAEMAPFFAAFDQMAEELPTETETVKEGREAAQSALNEAGSGR